MLLPWMGKAAACENRDGRNPIGAALPESQCQPVLGLRMEERNPSGGEFVAVFLDDGCGKAAASLGVARTQPVSGVDRCGQAQGIEVVIEEGADEPPRILRVGVETKALPVVAGGIGLFALRQWARACLLYTSPSPRDS